MNKPVFILPRLVPRDSIICKIVDAIEDLPTAMGFRVEILEHKSTRSLAQNAYLWAVYENILSQSVELQGWTKDDLHEFFLGSHFGWNALRGFGKTRLKPIRRSSKLSKIEFAQYTAFIQQFMAERGIYIADPEEFRGSSKAAA